MTIHYLFITILKYFATCNVEVHSRNSFFFQSVSVLKIKSDGIELDFYTKKYKKLEGL